MYQMICPVLEGIQTMEVLLSFHLSAAPARSRE